MRARRRHPLFQIELSSGNRIHHGQEHRNTIGHLQIQEIAWALCHRFRVPTFIHSRVAIDFENAINKIDNSVLRDPLIGGHD